MSQVELLTRAINVLETLKKESTPGKWYWDGDFSEDDVRLEGWDETVLSASGLHAEGYVYISRPNADLIVTLHRTIDAQLALLRFAVKNPLRTFSGNDCYDNHATALAHAILGDDV